MLSWGVQVFVADLRQILRTKEYVTGCLRKGWLWKYKNGLKQTVTIVITLRLAIPELVAILRQYVYPKEYVTVYLRNGYLLLS